MCVKKRKGTIETWDFTWKTFWSTLSNENSSKKFKKKHWKVFKFSLQHQVPINLTMWIVYFNRFSKRGRQNLEKFISDSTVSPQIPSTISLLNSQLFLWRKYQQTKSFTNRIIPFQYRIPKNIQDIFARKESFRKSHANIENRNNSIDQ